MDSVANSLFDENKDNPILNSVESINIHLRKKGKGQDSKKRSVHRAANDNESLRPFIGSNDRDLIKKSENKENSKSALTLKKIVFLNLLLSGISYFSLDILDINYSDILNYPPKKRFIELNQFNKSVDSMKKQIQTLTLKTQELENKITENNIDHKATETKFENKITSKLVLMVDEKVKLISEKYKSDNDILIDSFSGKHRENYNLIIKNRGDISKTRKIFLDKKASSPSSPNSTVVSEKNQPAIISREVLSTIETKIKGLRLSDTFLWRGEHIGVITNNSGSSLQVLSGDNIANKYRVLDVTKKYILLIDLQTEVNYKLTKDSNSY